MTQPTPAEEPEKKDSEPSEYQRRLEFENEQDSADFGKDYGTGASS